MPINPVSQTGQNITIIRNTAVRIGTRPLPSPSEYRVDVQEITKSSRNAKGDLFKWHLNWKHSISLVWYAVPKSMVKDIEDLTNSTGRISVTYYDPTSNTYKTGSFYRGTDYKVTATGKPTWSTSGTPPRPTYTGNTHYRVEMTLVEY